MLKLEEAHPSDLIFSLGTTNSAVAILEGKTPKIIENAEGETLKSYWSATSNGWI